VPEPRKASVAFIMIVLVLDTRFARLKPVA